MPEGRIKKPRRTPRCRDGAGTEKRPSVYRGGIIEIRQSPSANLRSGNADKLVVLQSSVSLKIILIWLAVSSFLTLMRLITALRIMRASLFSSAFTPFSCFQTIFSFFSSSLISSSETSEGAFSCCWRASLTSLSPSITGVIHIRFSSSPSILWSVARNASQRYL